MRFDMEIGNSRDPSWGGDEPSIARFSGIKRRGTLVGVRESEGGESAAKCPSVKIFPNESFLRRGPPHINLIINRRRLDGGRGDYG